jgi:hypothetical protein
MLIYALPSLVPFNMPPYDSYVPPLNSHVPPGSRVLVSFMNTTMENVLVMLLNITKFGGLTWWPINSNSKLS